MSRRAQLPDVGTPPVAEADAAAVAKAAELTPVSTPAPDAPSTDSASVKRKPGQRGPDKRSRKRPKDRATATTKAQRATKAQFDQAVLDEKAAPLSLPPLSPTGPDAVARLSRGLAQLAGLVGMVAASAFDVEKLSADEANAIGDSWAEILAPHLGDHSGDAVKWVTAGAVTLGVVLPRVKAARKARKVSNAEPAPVTVAPAPRGPMTTGGPIIDSATAP